MCLMETYICCGLWTHDSLANAQQPAGERCWHCEVCILVLRALQVQARHGVSIEPAGEEAQVPTRSWVGREGPALWLTSPFLLQTSVFSPAKQESRLEDLLAPFVPCCSTAYFVSPSQPGPGFCGRWWGKMHTLCRLEKATATSTIKGPSKAVNQP